MEYETIEKIIDLFAIAAILAGIWLLIQGVYDETND